MVEGESKRLRTWDRRVSKAKKGHRPSLVNWARNGFGCNDNAANNNSSSISSSKYQQFEKYSKTASNTRKLGHCFVEKIDKFQYIRNNSSNDSYNMNGVDRISSYNLSRDNFVRYYESQGLPLIISDIPQQECWDACSNWADLESIRSKYKDCLFKCGEDDEGYKIKIKMKYFLKYLAHNVDDSPLYIFDSNYDDGKVSKSLLEDYAPPAYFAEDLFFLCGERRRPPYRWFLLGPKRSGTCVHTDPLATSAWNTVIKGRKRWVLFPPHTPKNVVKGTELIKKGEDDEAINYFLDILPRIKERYGIVGNRNGSSDSDYTSGDNSSSNSCSKYGKDGKNCIEKYPVIEFTQLPGDTVFVPGGWWHAVLNLDDTVAITQNFCSRQNFDDVWRRTRVGRKGMAVKWLNKLEEYDESLYRRAIALNTEDGYDFEDENVNRRLRKKAKK